MSGSTPNRRERAATKALEDVKRLCDKRGLHGKARDAAITIDDLLTEMEQDTERSKVRVTGFWEAGT